MNYKIHDEFEQGTAEWLKFKIKHPLSGTQAFNLLKKGKTQAIKDSIQAQENSLNRPFKTAATQWGVDNEPIARSLLNKKLSQTEEYSHIKFEEHGMIESLDYDLCAYSPDGVYLENNKVKCLCEIKCFQMSHAWKIWTEDEIDEHIICQIQWGLFLTDAKMCFFCMYCPMMNDETLTPDHKRHIDKVLYIKRVFPDKNYFDAFKKALE